MKGQLGHQVLADHRLVHDEAARDVVHEVERAVEREERLGEREAAVGGVVERALEPLRGGGVVGVADEVHDEAREAADALAAHGVALVGHGGGADLLVLEGLVDLLAVAEEADVGGDLVEDGGGGGEVPIWYESVSRNCTAERNPHCTPRPGSSCPGG
jgi:hypothetical protein